MSAYNFGGAQQGAQVLRVFECVQDQDQRGFATLLGQLEDIMQGDIRVCAGFKEKTLIPRLEAIEVGARTIFYGNFLLVAKFEDIGQLTFPLSAFNNQQAENLPATSAQYFIDRISAVNPFSHHSIDKYGSSMIRVISNARLCHPLNPRSGYPGHPAGPGPGRRAPIAFAHAAGCVIQPAGR